jgi:uncharacterized protein
MATEEFTFIAADGVELAGTLELPDADRPAPAALLLVGSGEVDRDSDHPKLALGVTRELAAALAQAGIASLRYDKRGVGASGGDFLTTTFDDARQDAVDALAALRGHPAVDPARVLVIGHSEGAVHATSLAAADASLAGLGILAGPAVTGETTMRWQAAKIVPTLPALARALMRVLRQTPDRAQAKLFTKVRATDEAVLRVQGQRLNAGWLRGFLDHDPSADLARLPCPCSPSPATGTYRSTPTTSTGCVSSSRTRRWRSTGPRRSTTCCGTPTGSVPHPSTADRSRPVSRSTPVSSTR